MDYNAFIGIASFICGIIVMFAIHRVVFDHYANAAEEYIDDLKKQIKEMKEFGLYIEVEHKHTFATPDDVTNLKFFED